MSKHPSTLAERRYYAKRAKLAYIRRMRAYGENLCCTEDARLIGIMAQATPVSKCHHYKRRYGNCPSSWNAIKMAHFDKCDRNESF